MAVVANVYQKRLEGIKKNILEAYVYFEKNRNYYNTTRKFVLKSNITPDQEAALKELERPVLQFNSLEAYVSRLLGEFSKQSPSIEAASEPSEQPPSPEEVKFVGDHMRHIIKGLNSYEVYRDQLTGGYSCLKVWTEYENPKSFNQKICCDRVFDPLLIGFDPAAQKSHKGDGSYCFEIIPLTEDQFKEMHPDVDVSGCYENDISNFRWGYRLGTKNIILVCNYYEKKNRRVKIYRLSDNRVRTKKEYEEILQDYVDRQDVREPPSIIDERFADIPYVCRYQLTKSHMLEYKETDFCGLPLIFVDGNSVLLRAESSGSEIEQVVKSYVHNAIDCQRLKNVSGQTIANEIETMVQHKMKIALESIPTGYDDAYKNPQNASNYIYKAYKDDGITPLPAPQEVMKMPIPPEVINTFMGSDQLIQSALGSYDASLGINDNDLSGLAIVEGATQSNAAAMPFIVNFLAALQQMANIILDLIPKYYVTPRSIPIITNEGKREHISINNPNDPKSLKIQYNPSDLNVIVNPGVNFDVQKNKALKTLGVLAQAFPSIGAMLNQNGLGVIFDNLDIKGADQLKVMAEEWTKKQKLQQALAMKQQMSGQQNNPIMQKLQLEGQKAAAKDQNEKTLIGIKQQEVEIKQQEAAIKQQAQNLADAMAQIDAMNTKLENIIQLKKNETEREVHGVNLAMQKEENDRAHALKVAGHVHKVGQQVHKVATDLIGMQQSQQAPPQQKSPEQQENPI